MLIVNDLGVVGDCVLGSAFAVHCWLVVVRISAHRFQVNAGFRFNWF